MSNAVAPSFVENFNSPVSAAVREWATQAINKIESDFARSSDTHLLRLELPSVDGIDLYLKDESTHPTGSLKHRLARSLFLFGLCNGQIQGKTTIIEASSGSTAISEAHFARMLDLPFIAVVPKNTSPEKVQQIEFYGGRCHFVSPKDICGEAARLAVDLGGYYMDQFGRAESATDWRGNNNIAESIFSQMRLEEHPEPTWVLVGAGTGGTSATIGRYIRLKCLSIRLCVADPENSVFYDYFQKGDQGLTCTNSSMIEGIGRPRVEPSFMASVVDHMIKVPDAASIATIRFLEQLLGRRCGGSTGTCVYAAVQLIEKLVDSGKQGSVVAMICDSGERYLDTYYNDDWLAQQGYDVKPYLEKLNRFYTGDGVFC